MTKYLNESPEEIANKIVEENYVSPQHPQGFIDQAEKLKRAIAEAIRAVRPASAAARPSEGATAAGERIEQLKRDLLDEAHLHELAAKSYRKDRNHEREAVNQTCADDRRYFVERLDKLAGQLRVASAPSVSADLVWETGQVTPRAVAPGPQTPEKE